MRGEAKQAAAAKGGAQPPSSATFTSNLRSTALPLPKDVPKCWDTVQCTTLDHVVVLKQPAHSSQGLLSCHKEAQGRITAWHLCLLCASISFTVGASHA